MDKDIEWLKDKIKDEERNLKYVYDNYVPYENVLIADDVYDLIDQLDEPEKTVIPQKIADFIEKSKGKSHSLAYAINSTEVIKWFSEKHRDEWLYSNERENLFARAWLDGYEVEQERVYWIVMPTGHIAYRSGNGISYVDEHYKKNSASEKFTESEIKAIDERYWAFAEEVVGND